MIYFCQMKLPNIGIVFNWRNQVNISGLYPIHLRIQIDQYSRYYRIEVPKKITFDDWSGKDDCWVKDTHPFAFEINNKIREKKNIVFDLIKRSYNFNKKIINI